MVAPPIVITKVINPPVFDVLLNKVFRESTDAALLEMAQYLQENSPRGVSPIQKSLKGSWDIVPTRKIRNFPRYEGSITNIAENAIYRFNGRGPGRFPPFGPGSPLAQWAAAKGIPAFLVARKIAREGTERWKQGSRRPTLGLDRESKLAIEAEKIFVQTLSQQLASRGVFL